jgi:hypothetical protein
MIGQLNFKAQQEKNEDNKKTTKKRLPKSVIYFRSSEPF